MTYAPGAPEQVWAIDDLDDGAKLTLMWLWSRADHEAQRDPMPTQIRVGAFVDEDGARLPPVQSLVRTIQERVHRGKTERTIRGHLTRLRKLGLAEHHGRYVDLVPPLWESCGHSGNLASGNEPPSTGHSFPTTGHSSPQGGHSFPNQLSPPIPPLNSPLAPPPNIATEKEDRVNPATPVETESTLVADAPTDAAPPVPPVPSPSPTPEAPTTSQQRDDRATSDPEPRARSETPTTQVEIPSLASGKNETTDFASLRALHEKLRRAAQKSHGLRESALPKPTSKKGRALDRRLRKAILELGAARCEEILRWRSEAWLEDPGQLEWSTDSAWSPKSLKNAAEFMARPSRARGRNTGGYRAPELKSEAEIAKMYADAADQINGRTDWMDQIGGGRG